MYNKHTHIYLHICITTHVYNKHTHTHSHTQRESERESERERERSELRHRIPPPHPRAPQAHTRSKKKPRHRIPPPHPRAPQAHTRSAVPTSPARNSGNSMPQYISLQNIYHTMSQDTDICCIKSLQTLPYNYYTKSQDTDICYFKSLQTVKFSENLLHEVTWCKHVSLVHKVTGHWHLLHIYYTKLQHTDMCYFKSLKNKKFSEVSALGYLRSQCPRILYECGLVDVTNTKITSTTSWHKFSEISALARQVHVRYTLGTR